MAGGVEVMVRVRGKVEPALCWWSLECPDDLMEELAGVVHRLELFFSDGEDREDDEGRGDGGETCAGDGRQEGKRTDVRSLSNRALGARGEAAAARYLERMGYAVLERNWRCTYGEADIIALDQDGSVCFVEVKTRRNMSAGMPEEALTAAKQAHYERIAMCYLAENRFEDGTPVRFDAIGICVTDDGHAMLRHHRGCFDECC